MQQELEDLTEGLVRGRLTMGELAGLAPRELDALYALATERIDTGRVADAHKMLAALVALFPFSGRYWRAYGIALQRLLRLREAKAAYDAALVLEPNHPFTVCHRGEVLLYLGDTSQAEIDFEAVGKSGYGPLANRAKSLLALMRSPAWRPPAAAPSPQTRPPRIIKSDLSLSDGRVLPLSESRLAKAADRRKATPGPMSDDASTTPYGLVRRSTQVTYRDAREVTETAIVRRRAIPRPNLEAATPRDEATQTAVIRQRDLQPPAKSMHEEVTQSAIAQRRSGLPLADDDPSDAEKSDKDEAESDANNLYKES